MIGVVPDRFREGVASVVLDALADVYALDDVQEVYSNADFPASAFD